MPDADWPAGAGDETNSLTVAQAAELALQLSQRLSQTPDLATITLTEKLWTYVVASISADIEMYPFALYQLGTAALVRFERTREPDSLHRAIDCLQEAAEKPADDTTRAGIYANLGYALQSRYERDGKRADLDATIAASEQALELTPAGDPDRPAALSNLATALLLRFRLTGSLTDVDAAAEKLRVALSQSTAAAGSRPLPAEFLANLGNVLWERAVLTEDPADLDQAVEALDTAAAETARSRPHYATMQYNLGGALLTRYRQSGQPGDLQRAVTVLEDSVAAAPEDHPDRVKRQARLKEARDLSGTVAAAALAVLDRIGRIRETGDKALSLEPVALGEARQLAGLLRGQSKADATAWQTLGWIHMYRWQAQSAEPGRADFDVAVDAFAHCLVDGGDVPEYFLPAAAEAALDLAAGVSERALLTGDTVILTSAARLWWRLLAVIPAGHPARAAALARLGSVLRARLALPSAPPPTFPFDG